MEFESLSGLSNEEVVAKVQEIHCKNCQWTAELILHLGEMETRRAYLELGYSSLHAYCREKLKCSEGGANRRVRAAWCLLVSHKFYDLIKTGATTLCALAAASPVVNAENYEEVIARITGKSTREVEKVAAEFGAPVTRRKGTVRVKRVVQSISNEPDLFSASKDSTPTLESGSNDRLAETSPEPTEAHHFSYWGSPRMRALYEAARARHRNLSMEEIFEKALEALDEKEQPKIVKPRKIAQRKPSDESKRSRVISRPIRRAVIERDQGQCSYVSPEGKRCSAKVNLHVHHVNAFGKGGGNDLSNLKLCCRAHNMMFAERDFGKDYMQQFRKHKITPTLE